MLLIKTWDKKEILWEAIDGKLILNASDNADINDVVEIEADGYEFVLIHNSFLNIPCHALLKRGKWFGDTAKFILANMQ